MVFLRYTDLKSKGVPFSRVHVARLEKSGQFPKHVALGANSICWVESEVDAWLASRVAARDKAAA